MVRMVYVYTWGPLHSVWEDGCERPMKTREHCHGKKSLEELDLKALYTTLSFFSTLLVSSILLFSFSFGVP